MNNAISGEEPCIRISATLSADTLSISSTTRSSPPIYLNIRLRVINFSTPFNIQRFCSFTNSHQLSTGDHLPALKVVCLRMPHIETSEPKRQLPTFYPNTPSPEISIEININIFPHHSNRTSDRRDPKPYLVLLATQISELQAGERYETGLKDIDGEMPAYIWWYDRGTLQDVKERLGENGSVVPKNCRSINERHVNENAASPRIEIQGKLVLRVVK